MMVLKTPGSSKVYESRGGYFQLNIVLDEIDLTLHAANCGITTGLCCRRGSFWAHFITSQSLPS